MADFLSHTTGPNERWDHLAYRYYGDANRTSPIVRANRSLFLDQLGPVASILPVGIVLRIPVLDGQSVSDEALPPWKRGEG